MFDYSFTVAYISAKETSILTREAANRIAADRTDAPRLLLQSGYGGGDGGTVSDLTDRELSDLRRFIMDNMPDQLYPLLILPYDAHNLKVLLKCTVSGSDPAPYLYDNTVYDTEIAAACCRGGEFSLLSDVIAEILNPAYDNGMLSAPFDISTECDRAFYTQISKTAETAPEPLGEYIKAEIDGKNLISYYRAKNTKLPADSFEKLILPGGGVPERIFTGAYASGADDLREYTFGYDAHDAFRSASEAYSRSMTDMKDVLDAYAASKLEPYKYETDSPAPVFLYFKKKLTEARYIREAFSAGGGTV